MLGYGPPDARVKSVLIIDQSDDNREVLRTALQLRGMRTFEATGARQGLQLAQKHHPAVIVLDAESEAANDQAVRNQYDLETRRRGSSLVLLGTAPRTAFATPQRHVVSKPYQYGPLIRTIEQLLSQ